jgi:hypothetical protein
MSATAMIRAANERLRDAVQAVVVGHQHPVARLQRGHARHGQRTPEGLVVLGRAQRVDERRVNHVPRRS